MWKKLAIGVSVIVILVLLYAATRPDSFSVERSLFIKAPPEKIFVFLNDLHAFQVWSPWEKLDPQMKRTHSGAVTGPGAIYEWDGDRNIGAGRMEILESTPPTNIVIKLDFVRPLTAQNRVEFTLRPENDGTLVTWSMAGPVSYPGKLVGLVFGPKMVEDQFDQGLRNLKKEAETAR